MMSNTDINSLRYNEVAFKASHNSFQRDEKPVTTQLGWFSRKGSRHQGGCRGLELDIHQSDEMWLWSVAHLGHYQGDVDRQLSTYFGLLRAWSDGNRNHDVILITLDLKTINLDDRAFPKQLDAYIDKHLGKDKLYAPSQLQGVSDDLVTGARRNGWPILGSLRGKFILCLSGNEERKALYASAQNRLCFADKKLKGKPSPPRKGDRVFHNCNLGTARDYGDAVGAYADDDALIVRGYVLNTAGEWNRAKQAGVNILTTDKVRNYPWATVGDRPFAKLT